MMRNIGPGYPCSSRTAALRLCTCTGEDLVALSETELKAELDITRWELAASQGAGGREYLNNHVPLPCTAFRPAASSATLRMVVQASARTTVVMCYLLCQMSLALFLERRLLICWTVKLWPQRLAVSRVCPHLHWAFLWLLVPQQ